MTAAIHPTGERTARDLLVRIGIGQFNALQIIPFMFVSPATADPRQPAIELLVKKIQEALVQLGASVRINGYLDLPTASALTAVVGERWETSTYAFIVQALLDAKTRGFKLVETIDQHDDPNESYGFGAADVVHVRSRSHRGELAGIPGVPGLPDVPGGILTYGIAAYFLYRHFKKKKG